VCGIVAEVAASGIRDTRCLREMTSLLRHRGPDDEGYLLVSSTDGSFETRFGDDTPVAAREGGLPIDSPVMGSYDVALGHRRLSIIDLSLGGHQPMSVDRGRAWIVYNGEIYNYLELRRELEERGHAFRTDSDTEVVLRAYLEWGPQCLQRFNGMWAFCLWDAAERLMFCARDRFGIKPLYYWASSGDMVAASEIKALTSNPRVPLRPNERVVYDFVALGLLDHSRETFFEDVLQVPPGHHLIHRPGEAPQLQRYWSLDEAAPQPGRDSSEGQDLVEAWGTLFTDAVRLHLRSDVPLGTCLSGGLDSSAIVCTVRRLLAENGAVAQEAVSHQQRTFTAVFPGLDIDESDYVTEVVRESGAANHRTAPSYEGLWQELERLMWHQDEPVQGSSVYAQWNVMRLAADHGIKVLLDGQGADELLGGYRVYLGVHLNDLLLTGQWRRLLDELVATPRATDLTYTGVLREWGRAATYRLPAAGRRFLRGRLRVGERIVRPELQRGGGAAGGPESGRSHDLNTALIRDATVFNLPSLLHYEDRNSMAFSVEARVPFVDYRLAESAAALPAEWKIRHGQSKFILREAMRGVVPEMVRARRDKMGFVTPHQRWMREGAPFLRELLLTPESRAARFVDQGVLGGEMKRALASDRAILGTEVWRVASLEAWMRAFAL
jgi:asparagine synthase (glutamine-hydrolysing)